VDVMSLPVHRNTNFPFVLRADIVPNPMLCKITYVSVNNLRIGAQLNEFFQLVELVVVPFDP
jgi:hypothetical protein